MTPAAQDKPDAETKLSALLRAEEMGFAPFVKGFEMACDDALARGWSPGRYRFDEETKRLVRVD